MGQGEQPFPRRGLGLRSLGEFNKVVQGKWLWRFMEEKGSYWWRETAAKHMVEGRGWFSEFPRKSHGMGLWKTCMGRGELLGVQWLEGGSGRECNYGEIARFREVPHHRYI